MGLHTLHEVSKDNLLQLGWTLMSDGSDDRSDKSVYRAEVEAPVKEGEFRYISMPTWAPEGQIQNLLAIHLIGPRIFFSRPACSVPRKGL